MGALRNKGNPSATKALLAKGQERRRELGFCAAALSDGAPCLFSARAHPNSRLGRGFEVVFRLWSEQLDLVAESGADLGRGRDVAGAGDRDRAARRRPWPPPRCWES
ncbi:hypothetical protein GCM10010404_90500 [Nonomuraea africana]